MTQPQSDPATEGGTLTSRQLGVLQISVLVVALCGIVYELIIAAVSAYLLGDSVYQFSITIGLFMFAMGVGSYLTRRLERDLLERFVQIEVAIALIGGLSSTILFLVFPWRAFYVPVMYLLIIVIGTMVGLEIPILTRLLSRTDTLRNSIAKVLSLDYLGGLIGSVAFPLVLLPHLGMFRASFGIGLLNFIIALLNILVFWQVLRRPRRLMVITVVGLVVLTAGMIFGKAVTAYAEGRLFADTVLYQQHTRFQRIVVTRHDVTGKIRLFLDGHLQFAEQDEHRYHEALVHPVMSVPGPRGDVLILGGGDGLAVRELLKYPEIKKIDLVDIDPAMTDLSRSFAPIVRLNEGALEHPKVTIYNEDAFAFVRTHLGAYDRVIVDLPDPHNEALSKLYSVEFYRLLRRTMRSDGWFVTQSTSPFFTRDVFWSIAETVRAAGMEPLSYHITVPSFGEWGFTLGGGEGKVAADFKVAVPTTFIDDRVLAAAQVFPADTRPREVAVNSVFEPRMYQLYLAGLYQ